MAQHDYTIANQTFPATRTDINNALAAIVSANSGATAPTTTYAYQLWYDTTTDILKMRNANDDAWIDLFDVDQVADTAAPSTGGDGTFNGDVTIGGDLTVDTNTLYVDSTNNRVGVGTITPTSDLEIASTQPKIKLTDTDGGVCDFVDVGGNLFIRSDIDNTEANSHIRFDVDGSEAMRINDTGRLLYATTDTNPSVNNVAGATIWENGRGEFSTATAAVLYVNKGNDGTLLSLRGGGTAEGSINVNGTTVSFNGGHLSRWSQLTDGTRDETIVKGTVLTNLDQMAVWHHEAVAAQDAVLDERGNVVTEAVEAKDAYTEDNEQLNCMAVSSVEGDPNVAGVFVSWDDDDDNDFNDMNIAMTGDMVIRIAQGTTVQRGDLLMSAGDGTAKPQGDDIVRSKTIAKVTSTHVSHTYDDGSYLVPCVLMAC